MVSLRLLILAQEKDALSAAHVLHRDKHRAFCPGSLIGFSGYSPTQTSHQNWQAKFLLMQTEEGKRCKEISPIRNKHGWMHGYTHTTVHAYTYLVCIWVAAEQCEQAQPVLTSLWWFIWLCFSCVATVNKCLVCLWASSKFFLKIQSSTVKLCLIWPNQPCHFVPDPLLFASSKKQKIMCTVFGKIFCLCTCTFTCMVANIPPDNIWLLGSDNLSICGPKLWRNVPLLLKA